MSPLCWMKFIFTPTVWSSSQPWCSDETGHHPNQTRYVIMGADQNGSPPKEIFPLVDQFIGEGGTLDWPETFKNLSSSTNPGQTLKGSEALGGMRFPKWLLKQENRSAISSSSGLGTNLRSTSNGLRNTAAVLVSPSGSQKHARIGKIAWTNSDPKPETNVGMDGHAGYPCSPSFVSYLEIHFYLIMIMAEEAVVDGTSGKIFLVYCSCSRMMWKKCWKGILPVFVLTEVMPLSSAINLGNSSQIGTIYLGFGWIMVPGPFHYPDVYRLDRKPGSTSPKTNLFQRSLNPPQPVCGLKMVPWARHTSEN